MRRENTRLFAANDEAHDGTREVARKARSSGSDVLPREGKLGVVASLRLRLCLCLASGIAFSHINIAGRVGDRLLRADAAVDFLRHVGGEGSE